MGYVIKDQQFDYIFFLKNSYTKLFIHKCGIDIKNDL